MSHITRYKKARTFRGKSGLLLPKKKVLSRHEASAQLLLNLGGGGGGASSRSSSIRSGGGSSRSHSAFSSRSSHCGAVGSRGSGGRSLGASSRSLNNGLLGLLRLARRQTSGQGQAQGSNFEQVVHFGGNFENGLTKKRPLCRLTEKVTRPINYFFSLGYLPPAFVLTTKVNEQRQFLFFDSDRRRTDCCHAQWR